MPKRLLLLGGNRYNLPCIRTAREHGFYTIVADGNPEAPGLEAADLGLPIDFSDSSSLEEAVTKAGGIDGVVNLAEAGVIPAAEMARRLGVRGQPLEVARAVTSKAAMRRAWSDLGRWSVDFRVVESLGQALEAARDLSPFPLIFKPDRSFGGSRGVSRVDRLDSVAEAFEFAKAGGRPGSPVVIEPYVTGEEYSSEVLIDGEELSVLCIGHKVKTAGPYRVDLSVQYPSHFDSETEQEINLMCGRAVRALGMEWGAAHLEFALTAEGPVLFELGARCGGGHTPQIAAHVSGVDEFIAFSSMACGLKPEAFRPSRQLGADYRFLVFPPGLVEKIVTPKGILKNENVLDFGLTILPGQRLNPVRTTADRAGFAVTRGETLDQARAVADLICRQVEVHYPDGRAAHAWIPA